MFRRFVLAFALPVAVLAGSEAMANRMTDILVYETPAPVCADIPFDEWAKFEDCRLKYTIQLQDVLKKRDESNRKEAEELIKRPLAWLTGRPTQACSSVPPEELKKFF